MSDELDWVDLGNGKHVLRGKPPVMDADVRGRFRAPKGAHISTSLPRWCKFHRGPFDAKGHPIIRNQGDIDHIQGASNGKYVYQ